MSDQKQIRLKMEIPEALGGLFEPGFRYYIAKGGRGGAKSWSVGEFLLMESLKAPVRILCAREFQNSIEESVFKLLKNTIIRKGLEDYFAVQATGITAINGSEFLFKGLRHNITSVKSFEDVDIVWVEEAQNVSKDSWDMLIPTVRKTGSRFFITFNPDSELDDTYQRFIVNQRSDMRVMTINYTDNPFCPAEIITEAEQCKAQNPGEYKHIWLGATREEAGTTVFQKSWIQQCTPKHYGAMNKYITVDPANEKKKDSDYTVMTVWGLGSDRNYYVITWIRDRLNLTERAQALFSLVDQWKPLMVGYERYGMQSDIQYIRQAMAERNYRFPIMELGGSLSKRDRIKRMVPIFQTMRVWIPETCIRQTTEGQKDIVKEFLREYYAFNDDPDLMGHDDILDGMARIMDPELATTFPIDNPNPIHQPPRQNSDPIGFFLGGGQSDFI